MVMSNRRRRMAALYTVAVLGAVLSIFPYLYMVMQSLAPWNEVDRRVFPTSVSLRSYQFLLTGGVTGLARPWLRALFNSFLVTGVDTIAMLAAGMMVGYALARLPFRGARVIRSFLLFQMFYPSIILLIPTFLIIRYLGLYNSYLGMILPKAVNLWAIFMFTSFFASVDRELVEAARVDGASEWTVIARIMLPMSRTIATVVGLVLFMERWSELLWDLLVVKDPNRMTLNVLLATMKGPYGTYPGPMYAGSVLLTLPIVIAFVVFSKRFLSGFQFIFR